MHFYAILGHTTAHALITRTLLATLPFHCKLMPIRCKFTFKLGCFTEIIHLHAASSVIGEAIESVYPLQNNHYTAWNRDVTDVTSSSREPS